MASISRFGRAISSGKSRSDNSFASSASVSSAVWSSRLAKSDWVVPVVIKSCSWSGRPGQSLMARASSIPLRGAGLRLETAGKDSKSLEHTGRARAPRPSPRTRNPDFAHCPKSVADRAGLAAVALSGGAVLSRRPSGLDPDGLALFDRRAGVAAMGRSRRGLALFAALGGGRGGCEFLPSSRHRLRRAARGDRRRRGGGRGHARRFHHHPAGGEEPVPVAGGPRGPPGGGVSAGAVDRPGRAEASDSRNLPKTRRARPLRPVRRAGGGDLRLRPPGIVTEPARGSAAGGELAQPG